MHCKRIPPIELTPHTFTRFFVSVRVFQLYSLSNFHVSTAELSITLTVYTLDPLASFISQLKVCALLPTSLFSYPQPLATACLLFVSI